MIYIAKVLDASTAHIKGETSNMLEANKNRLSDIIVRPFTGNGWMIWVPVRDTVDSNIVALRMLGHEDLAALMQTASDNGCEYIHLHSSGVAVTGLKTYNWS